MSEASHGDIINRIGAVERRQAEMQSQLRVVADQASAAKTQTAENRKHLDDRMLALEKRSSETHEQVVDHRAEFRGLTRGMAWGFTLLGFVVTTGLVIVIQVVS